ncbi:MAG: glycosyltransferase family 2 protein [Bacteroidaceae bacterium]|nr:glycosyltransferase family 2 protein [Bacteroidaceae bacterium]
MTAIILVNWNGADDTIACLASLQAAEGDFFVVVADNASSDNSVQRISEYINEYEGVHKVHLLSFDDNYGFAIGNNKAIEFASSFSPSSYMLLNNDTEVEPDFLVHLVEFSSANPQYKAITPRINFFSEKDIIWESGAKIFLGKRDFGYANKKSSLLDSVEYMPITSISGCALFFVPELLDKDGHIFTDRYFFGEEDFEFSMRMRKNGIKMACVPASKIYHKVGRSRNKMKGIANVGKFYMYYLNRFITLRMYMSSLEYCFVQMLYIPNCFRTFYGVNHSIGTSWKMLRRLLREARTKYGVSKDDFRALMIDNDYFDK